MADAGTLSVNVTARLDDLKSKFDAAVSQANGFANRMSTIGNKNYFAPMQETFKGMKRDLGQIVQGIILAQAFYQGIQLFKNLTAAVYEYTDALNYASVTFSNLFRDASLGEEFVAVLQQYAARSPFDFTDIEKGARQLAAYGIQAKNLMYVMQGIGNLSAVTGDPQTFDTVSRALGQIYAKGKLSAEEMRQLAEAGLNVKAVYERLGVDASNVAKANIDAGTAINAIIDTLNDSYAGAMNAANMTMRGMIGNVKDVLLSVVSAVYQPAYEKMQRVLLGFQQTLNDFQDTFQTEGLAAAIEKTFGPEALTRVQQVIAIFQYLGNTIYQLLVPAFQILGMYGEAAISVIQSMLVVIGPMLNTFAAFLHTILSSAEGVRVLQTALMGLAVMKIVGGFAGFLSGAMGILMTVVANTAKVATAASATLGALTAGEIASANGAVLAGNAWVYFSKALNVNPIVLAITVVLALIAAIVGLRNILGKTTDLTASLGGNQWSEYFKNIKQGTGDINKFNQALDKTEGDIDDVNDELDKTKKKQEGLLSFDEVFKIPETASASKAGSGDDTDIGEGVIPDLGDFELPEIEPLDFKDLLPDLNSLWDWINDWIKNQPWAELASIITKGIATGLKKASYIPSKAAQQLMKDIGKVITKELDRFNIKDKIKKLAEDVKEGKTSWEKGGKELVDSLTKEIEEQLGPEKTKKLKVKEKLEDVIKSAEEGKSSWKKTGKVLVEDLNKGINEEFLKIQLKGKTYREQLILLAEELEKASPDFKKTGGKLSDDFYKALEEELAKPKEFVPTAFDENVSKEIAKGIDGKNIFKVVSEKFAQVDFSELPTIFLTKIKNAFTPAKVMAFLKTGLKDMGITLVGEMLFDELANWLDTNGETAAAAAVSNFGPVVASGIGTAIATKSPWGFVVGAIWGSVFQALDEGLNTGNWSSFLSQIAGSLGVVLSKLATKLGMGAAGGPVAWVGAIGSVVSDLIFGSIIDSLRASGDEQTADILDSIDGAVGGALGGAGMGAAIGSIFPGIGTAIGAIAGAIIGGLAGALTDNWDKISTWFNETAVPWFQDLPNKIGEFFTNADQWLSDPGKNIFAGLYNGIKTSWEGITEFFSGLFGTILGFFTGDDQLLHDSGYNLMDGLYKGILGQWEIISGFFGDILKNILAFFTGDDSWLTKDGEQILAGLLNGITTWWTQSVVPWWQNLPSNLWNFFTNAGTWLVTAGQNIVTGLKNGITNWWTQSVVPWWQNLPTNVVNFFTNAGNWLWNAGGNIISGFFNGLKQKFEDVKSWFSGIGDWIVQHKGPESYDKNLLVNAGQWIMQGLQTGLNKGLPNVDSIISSIGPAMQQMFQNAGNWLSTAGSNITVGLYNGIIKNVQGIYGIFTDLTSGITRAFSNSSNLLSTAGYNIMIGFHNGLVESFSYVKDFIWSVGDWIANNKGPEAYDKALLKPAGKWIMGGFETSLSDQFQDVLAMVKTFGPQMETAFAAPQLSVTRADIPAAIVTTQPAVSTQETQTASTTEVPNPFLNSGVQTEAGVDTQRPILYVGTLIADKQGLRKLKKELDVVEAEQSRYK